MFAILYNIKAFLARKLQIRHLVIETFRNARLNPLIPHFSKKRLLANCPNSKKIPAAFPPSAGILKNPNVWFYYPNADQVPMF
jgi:hypothetical protein